MQCVFICELQNEIHELYQEKSCSQTAKLYLALPLYTRTDYPLMPFTCLFISMVFHSIVIPWLWVAWLEILTNRLGLKWSLKLHHSWKIMLIKWKFPRKFLWFEKTTFSILMFYIGRVFATLSMKMSICTNKTAQSVVFPRNVSQIEFCRLNIEQFAFKLTNASDHLICQDYDASFMRPFQSCGFGNCRTVIVMSDTVDKLFKPPQERQFNTIIGPKVTIRINGPNHHFSQIFH